ncbi:MAG: aryl-sulfate sulfotransferase [Planctomycetes bacterium]|nr:aryl-sulfate sulfotransferase [Planctomycetota bacterium]
MPLLSALLLCLLLAQDPAPKPADAQPEAPKALPKGFPKPDEVRGVRVRESSALEGYVLLAPLNSKTISLIDFDGAIKHSGKTEEPPGGGTYFLPNGHILRCGQQDPNPRFHGGGIGGHVQELDWDGTLLWEYELDNDQLTQHHDIKLLPNGNVLVIAWEYHSKEEVLAHGRLREYCDDEGLWCDLVQEVKPVRPRGGEVVWQWRTWDHLVQDQDAQKPGYGKIAEHPERIDLNGDRRYSMKQETEEERQEREQLEREMKRLGYAGDDDKPKKGAAKPAAPKNDSIDSDWLHTNAVDYLPSEDLIVLSTPHMSELWVIDHSTTTSEAASESGGRWKHGGGLLYRYGNARKYGMGEASDRKLFYQHNAQWLPGAAAGELHLLVYNNGAGRPENEYSSVEELALPFDREKGFVREAGRAFGPEKALWSYSQPEKFFSPFISGAQRLPNGDTLVCEGVKGRAFEIDSGGKILWDYWSPLGGDIEPTKTGGHAPANALFRATWVPKDFAGLKGKL